MKNRRGPGFVPIVILLVAVFGTFAVSTGAVYWVKQINKKPIVPKTPQPTLDVDRALTPTIERTAERSGTAADKQKFTMKPPQGWVRPTDTGVQAQIHFAAPEPDFFKDKSGGYFSNIVADIGAHQKGYSKIKDYQKNYRFELTQTYSGTTIRTEGVKTINGYQVYYIESITPDPKDGNEVHRLQYLFMIDETYVLGALGSALEGDGWDRDGAKIKASLESIKIEKPAAAIPTLMVGTPTANVGAATPTPTGTWEFLPEYQPGEKPY